MFDRFAEDARRAIAIATQEAARLGLPYVEGEHLLVGISRSSDPELKQMFRLQELEEAILAHQSLDVKPELSEKPGSVPLSDSAKRTWAYAMEEAVRLNSPEVGCGHLLLGVLRESESAASRLLIAHKVDLELARRMVVSSLTRSAAASSSRPIGLASRIKRRYWIATAVQLAVMVVLGLAVAISHIAGRYLLIIGGVWFLAALAWFKLGPSSFFFSLGRQNRAKVALIYVFGWFYGTFMFGWLLPLSIGIYRVAVR